MDSLPNAPLSLSASTNGVFRIFVVTVSTIGTAINAAVDALYVVGRRVRDWLYTEPLLPKVPNACPPIVSERVILRSKAPVASFEPAFVGSGLARRCWR